MTLATMPTWLRYSERAFAFNFISFSFLGLYVFLSFIKPILSYFDLSLDTYRHLDLLYIVDNPHYFDP